MIFKYYALDWDERFAWKDVSYKLDNSDLKEIEKATIENFGDKTWQKFDDKFKEKIISEVKVKYQEFFASSKNLVLKIRCYYFWVLPEFLKVGKQLSRSSILLLFFQLCSLKICYIVRRMEQKLGSNLQELTPHKSTCFTILFKRSKYGATSLV